MPTTGCQVFDTQDKLFNYRFMSTNTVVTLTTESGHAGFLLQGGYNGFSHALVRILTKQNFRLTLPGEKRMLTIITLPVLTDNYIYLIHDPVSMETAAVDPALAQPVLTALEQNGWHLNTILNTHHHHDHVGGNLELKQKTGCKVIAATADRERIPGIDLTVKEHDMINIGNHAAKIIATPGHTSGHIVYHFADDGLLFCGDTLFVMGCGRLFEGSAEQMWHSLQKIKSLPPETRIYCTHEYTQNNGRFALTVEPDNLKLQEKMIRVNQLRANGQITVPSTLAEELATNPFLREDSPALRQAISMDGKTPVEVFARVRQMKDRF